MVKKDNTYKTKKKRKKKKIIQNVENATDEHQKRAFVMTQNQSFKFIQI